jgi:tRNA(fMet)-specific endonuclease VapC
MAPRRKNPEYPLIDNVLNTFLDLVVVDTDVMSYVFKKDTRADLYERHLAGKELIISFVTLGELHRWAIKRNWGTAKRRKLEEYLSPILVYHSDDNLCLRWAEITENGRSRGRPVQPADAWIAATALLYDLPLITHNRWDFDGIPGLKVISEASG